MSRTLDVSVTSPPMPIQALSRTLKLTYVQPMVLRLDGQEYVFTIPRTYCRRQGLGRWLVDACEGNTDADSPVEILAELPPEPAGWDWLRFTVTARAIPVLHHVRLPDGSIYQGPITYPKCPILWQQEPMIATEFTVAGTLERV